MCSSHLCGPYQRLLLSHRWLVQLLCPVSCTLGTEARPLLHVGCCDNTQAGIPYRPAVGSKLRVRVTGTRKNSMLIGSHTACHAELHELCRTASSDVGKIGQHEGKLMSTPQPEQHCMEYTAQDLAAQTTHGHTYAPCPRQSLTAQHSTAHRQTANLQAAAMNTSPTVYFRKRTAAHENTTRPLQLCKMQVACVQAMSAGMSCAYRSPPNHTAACSCICTSSYLHLSRPAPADTVSVWICIGSNYASAQMLAWMRWAMADRESPCRASPTCIQQQQQQQQVAAAAAEQGTAGIKQRVT
jgi:hypothetical protein